MEAMRSSIQQILYTKKPDLTMSHEDLEVTLSFYAYGIAGVVFEKCKSKSLDVEHLSQQLYKLLSGNMIEPYS